MMFSPPEWLLIGTVAAVGILHTMVPDHWVPITLIARQRGWTKFQTGRAAFIAGGGHVLTTLLIAAIVWIAGVATARAFGHAIDMIASAALVGFGGWILISSLLAMRKGEGHSHTHGHSHEHDFAHIGGGGGGIHGPELQQIATARGTIGLSIYEAGMPPHFRLTGDYFSQASAATIRPDGSRQKFSFSKKAGFWESAEEIPEPHGFIVELTLRDAEREHAYSLEFAEHEHGDHGHSHGEHGHDDATKEGKTSSRTALLLILGSSPMVEGIPAFFAAGKYGVGVIIAMSLVFGATTMATYVILCVASLAGLERVSLGPLERFGEVISGAFIAIVGLVFWLFPVL